MGGTQGIQTLDEGNWGGGCPGIGETLSPNSGLESVLHSPTGPMLTLPPRGVPLRMCPSAGHRGARPLLALPRALAALGLQAASAWH